MATSRAKTEVKILNEQVRKRQRNIDERGEMLFLSLAKVAKALAKQEAKREKKMTRKKEWDELYYRLEILRLNYRGILVKLVIRISSGHPKIKIISFVKYATFA